MHFNTDDVVLDVAGALGGVLGVEENYAGGRIYRQTAYNRKTLDAVLLAMRDEELGATLAMFGVVDENHPGVVEFRKDRKLVKTHEDVGGEYVVVPKVIGLGDQHIDEYPDTVNVPGSIGNSEYHATFSLDTIFSDGSVAEKLLLNMRQVETARRLSVVDPPAAARLIKSYLDTAGFINVKITSTQKVSSINNAKKKIRAYARNIVYKDSIVLDCVTTTEKLFLSYVEPTKTEKLWTVSGPLEYAVEVMAIYQLSLDVRNPNAVMGFLGLETAVLQINTRNELTGVYYTGKIKNYSSLEGILPLVSTFPSNLSSESISQLRRLSDRVTSVTYRDKTVGSAVQVSERYAIVASHTVDLLTDSRHDAIVTGSPLRAAEAVSVGISAIPSFESGVQWKIRDSYIGERVVVCYSVGDTTEYSDILTVMSVHDKCMSLSASKILRPGTSGGAIISLRDYSLLGIVDGREDSGSIIGSVFSTFEFTSVNRLGSVVSSEPDVQEPGSEGQITYDKMVRRGLNSYVLAVANATEGLYTKTISGERSPQGTLVVCRDGAYTTVAPASAELYAGDSDVPLKFHTTDQTVYFTSDYPRGDVEFPLRREAQPMEQIFIVSKVLDKVYMSSICAAGHIDSGGGFSTAVKFDSEAHMSGGVVMAVSDAAVVGILKHVSGDSDNMLAECVPVPLDSTAMVNQALSVAEANAVVESGGIELWANFGIGVMLLEHVSGVAGESSDIKSGVQLSSKFWQGLDLTDWCPAGWSKLEWQTWLPNLSRVEAAQVYLGALGAKSKTAQETCALQLKRASKWDDGLTPVRSTFKLPRESSENTLRDYSDD